MPGRPDDDKCSLSSLLLIYLKVECILVDHGIVRVEELLPLVAGIIEIRGRHVRNKGLAIKTVVITCRRLEVKAWGVEPLGKPRKKRGDEGCRNLKLKRLEHE